MKYFKFCVLSSLDPLISFARRSSLCGGHRRPQEVWGLWDVEATGGLWAVGRGAGYGGQRDILL